MRTARLTRPFRALGCRAPVLLALPAGAAMEDLAPPSLPALGPEEGPASASPAPQQQFQPSLRPRDGRPGSQGSLWQEARVAGAGPQGWGHPGSERGQQPAWLGLPMVPWCGPRCPGAALCPLPAQSEPRLLRAAPPPPRSPPPPRHTGLPRPARPGLARGPLPRGRLWAPAAAAPAARAPPPPPGGPGLSPQINGLPDTPAPPVQCPASQSQTDTQRWRGLLVTKKPGTHAHADTHLPKSTDRNTTAQTVGTRAGQTPGGGGALQVETREAGAGGGGEGAARKGA